MSISLNMIEYDDEIIDKCLDDILNSTQEFELFDSFLYDETLELDSLFSDYLKKDK